ISLDYIDAENEAKYCLLPQKILAAVTRIEEVAERIRLLYVAMTRAINGLYMYGTKKAGRENKWSSDPTPQSIINSHSMLDWLGMLLLRHKDGENLRNFLICGLADEMDIYNDASRWKINIIDKSIDGIEGTKQPDKRFNIQEYTDTGFARSIISNLEWKYPYIQDTLLPSKVSVTDITQNHRVSAADLICTDKFLYPDTPQLGKEFGTIMHKVLRELDIKECVSAEKARAQVSNMQSSGYLDPDEAAIVDIDMIVSFANSPLGKKLADSTPKTETPFCIMLPADRFTDRFGRAELLVQGIIDCWFIENGQIVLIDYKTDYYNTENEIIDRYKTQVEIYAYALENITEKKVKDKYIYLLRTGKCIEIK
ncbi:MAG TPA: PD-(D/E)XK nuclease family protein, partial [Clostridia bacterium]|nr:PD-(D/E)XK nuclease family protein [Clostridia bacterium]